MGQTITLTHLAPFVDISRQKYRKQVCDNLAEMQNSGMVSFSPAFNKERYINSMAERLLKEEIKRGVQTMQYQINTISSSNGLRKFGRCKIA